EFLGPAPSYVHIRDLGRRSGATLSGGHFIGFLATHFGLVGDQWLRGLSVVVNKLLVIDLYELARLNIYSRTRAGTSATATHSSASDYVIEDRLAQGGGARITTEYCKLSRSF
nr:hypothetical protein [Tanacetum cinerariifolium]